MNLYVGRETESTSQISRSCFVPPCGQMIDGSVTALYGFATKTLARGVILDRPTWHGSESDRLDKHAGGQGEPRRFWNHHGSFRFSGA